MAQITAPWAIPCKDKPGPSASNLCSKLLLLPSFVYMHWAFQMQVSFSASKTTHPFLGGYLAAHSPLHVLFNHVKWAFTASSFLLQKRLMLSDNTKNQRKQFPSRTSVLLNWHIDNCQNYVSLITRDIIYFRWISSLSNLLGHTLEQGICPPSSSEKRSMWDSFWILFIWGTSLN